MKRKWFVKYQTGKTLTENKTPTESVESMYHTSQINNPTPPPETTPNSTLPKLPESPVSDSPKEEKKTIILVFICKINQKRKIRIESPC